MIVTLGVRDDWMVVLGVEVLYRSRERDRSERVARGCSHAYERGRSEAAFGWPDDTGFRSPIFAVEAREGGTRDLIERHRRYPMGDRVLVSGLPGDAADLALRALRRAATLGAMARHTQMETRRDAAS